MSEKLIAEGIQTILQGMADFSAGDVTINDWGILDGSRSAAPYVVIQTSDDFVSRQDASSQVEVWGIKMHLFTEFQGWDALDDFRDTRQAIVDEFNEAGTNRAAAQSGLTDTRELRNEGEIDYAYKRYEDDDEEEVSDPDFVHQVIIFETFEEAD